MRAPAFFVFFETALGPIPQSAALPTSGSLRRRSNAPAGCATPPSTGKLPLGRGSLEVMDVLVAGGHGQIARHLLRQLAAAGHHGRAA